MPRNSVSTEKPVLKRRAFFRMRLGVIKLMTKTHKNQWVTGPFSLQKRKLEPASWLQNYRYTSHVN